MPEQINISSEVGMIWESADSILRDSYKRHQYQDVILPFLVLRRIESVLLEKREEIANKHKSNLKKLPPKEHKKIISAHVKTALGFDNTSDFTLQVLASEKESALKDNFRSYLNGYTQNIQEIMQNFKLQEKVSDLDKHKLLYQLVKQYCTYDLSPKTVSNLKMGYIFEELIRRFAEASNEEAGEHFTPREIIKLMVELLIDDDPMKPGELKCIYDPACGTGGMLTEAKKHILDRYPANIVLYGQEINPETYAICASDMLLKGEKTDNIKLGNTLTNDQLPDEKFDYMLSNPPFGKDWKKDMGAIVADDTGRFKEEMLPRVSDGSTLFLMQMLSKMKTRQEGGSSIAIVFNGSPLFTGNASSGESNFRKYLLENDLLDAIVALPTEMFYNTGISTYIWIVRNKKESHRIGKVQLINAVEFYSKMKKSLGNKRNEITPDHIRKIAQVYHSFKQGEHSKLFDNKAFGYTRVSLELSEFDSSGKLLMEKVVKTVNGKKTEIMVEKKIKDEEYVPLTQDISVYLKNEVGKPFKILAQDIGYEISFTQYFYKYAPIRSTAEIAKEITKAEKDGQRLMKELGLIK